MWNKVLFFYITFAVVFKLGTSPLAHFLYVLWAVLAGIWAFINLMGLWAELTSTSSTQKLHKSSLEATGMKTQHVKRGLWVSFTQIIIFIVFNEPFMACAFLLFVVPFLFRCLKLLEQDNKK